MIIDFRIRPPYKSFAKMGIFQVGGSTGNPYRDTIVNKGRKAIPSQEQKSMDLFMREMDEAEIDVAVIMGRKCGSGLALASANVENSDIYELMNKYPGRFVGFGGVDPLAPNPEKEIEYCIKELGFKGISIDPDGFVPAYYADNEVFTPIYETVNGLNAIMSITLSAMFGPDMSYADPTPLQRIAKQYPSMDIVIPHAAYPHVEKVAGLVMHSLNIHLIPDFYIYFDQPKMPMSETYVDMGNSVAMYRMLFASSYPAWDLKQCVEGWKKRNFTPEAMQCTLYDNAKRLLKI